MAYDPICGKKIQPVRETPVAEYRRRTYYFCSEHCRHEFEQTAERVRLVDAAASRHQPAQR